MSVFFNVYGIHELLNLIKKLLGVPQVYVQKNDLPVSDYSTLYRI